MWLYEEPSARLPLVFCVKFNVFRQPSKHPFGGIQQTLKK